jgi:sugar/nucleoside kinase (ribokinase family)
VEHLGDDEFGQEVAAFLRGEVRGSFAGEDDGLVEKAGYPVEVVDAAGAGAAFVADFLSGRLQA